MGRIGRKPAGPPPNQPIIVLIRLRGGYGLSSRNTFIEPESAWNHLETCLELLQNRPGPPKTLQINCQILSNHFKHKNIHFKPFEKKIKRMNDSQVKLTQIMNRPTYE